MATLPPADRNRISTMVWRCLLGLVPVYLQDLCCPTLRTRGRSSLRSVERGKFSLALLPGLPQAGPCILDDSPLRVNGLQLGQRFLPRALSDQWRTCNHTWSIVVNEQVGCPLD